MNLHQFVKMICDNHKTGQWLIGFYDVEISGKSYCIGVKTYGKCVQRLECAGLVISVEESKTLKSFAAAIEGEILLCCLNERV